MLARVLGLAVLFLALNSAQALEKIDFGRYHALVIGNNQYENLPDLQTAVSDAAAVAEILRLKYGFEVTLKINATRRDILSEINALRKTLTEKDRLLVYYAGHGVLDRETGTGYWLPIDAEPEDDTDWIANEALTRLFKAMSARHVMVVADSCFSGTLVRAADVAPKSGAERDTLIHRMAAKRSRTALVSGGLEPVLDEGSGGHSVFANAFLGVLRESNEVFDGQSLARWVRQQVVLNADQTPQYSDMRKADHEGGDFLFVPQGSTVVVVPPSEGGQTDERAMELAFWQTIKDGNDRASFEAYLKKFPNGTFAELAELKIKLRNQDGVARADLEGGDGQTESGENLRSLKVGLSIIADERAAAVDAWIDEQFRVLDALASNVSIQLSLMQMVLARTGQTKMDIDEVELAYLRNLIIHMARFLDSENGATTRSSAQRLGSIALTDRQGLILVATPDMPPSVPQLSSAMARAAAGGRALTNMYLGVSDHPTMGFVVPVYAIQEDAGVGKSLGLVVGLKPVGDELFSRLHKPGETFEIAESYLVQIGGGTVQYLSPLADGTQPLRRTLAVDTPNLAAVFAAETPGRLAIKQDYKNDKVLVTPRPITRMPWYVVSTVMFALPKEAISLEQ